MNYSLTSEIIPGSGKTFKSSNIFLIFSAALVICLNLIISIFSAVNSPFDPDEFQHLHIAWSVFNGKIIYKDFFEHHGCIYPFLNSIIFSVLNLKPDFQTIYIFRFTNLFYSIIILFLTYKIAKEISGSSIIGVLSSALLSSLVFFQFTTAQIRPDGIQNVFWLSGILLIVKNLDFKKDILSAGAGFLLALSVLTNPKAFIGPGALVCYFIFILAFKLNSKKIIIRNVLFFTIGFLIPYILISIYFISYNAIGPFIFYNYIFNVEAVLKYNTRHVREYFDFFWKYQTLYTCFALASIFYMLASVGKKKKNWTENKRYFFLLIITVVTSSSVLLGLYSDVYLIFLPFVSIVAAVLLFNIYTNLKKRTLIFRTAYTFIMLSLFIQLFYSKIDNTDFTLPQKTVRQKALVNYILKNTNRNDRMLFIWCDDGGFVFNSDLQYFWCENENFSLYYKKIAGYDVYGSSLINRLKKGKVKFIIGPKDRILRILSKDAYGYVLENFKRSQQFDNLWVRITKLNTGEKFLGGLKD